MIMANIEFMKGMPNRAGKPRQKDEDLVPFGDVYFTSIIRDAQGRKMSKSLGNSPEPLDVIAEYGADALRFTISYISPLGRDVLFSTDKCELGRNFANKIWNAGRFLLMNKAEICGDGALNLDKLPEEHLDLADRWILSRLNHSIKDLTNALGLFQINESTKVLYDFLWHDFCDWYVELVKTRFYGEESATTKKIVVRRALWIFDRALRMLHPVMPFISEELWQHLTDRKGASIMKAEFPAAESKWIDPKTEKSMSFVQNVISAVRNIRGENNIPPAKEINLQVVVTKRERGATLVTHEKYVQKLGKVASIEKIKAGSKPKLASSSVVDGIELFVPLEGLIDVGSERKRLEREIVRLEQMVESIQKKLRNPRFVERAPKEIVEKEKEKEENFRTSLEKLRGNLEHLG